MKVLMISGDKRMLEPSSDAYARLELQRATVEQLDVMVWPHEHSWHEVLKAARDTHYDVVTTQDPFWRGLLGWRAARRSGARLNVQLHTELAAQSWLKRTLGAYILRKAGSVRVVSQKIQDSLVPLRLTAPISVLPVYIDLSLFVGLVHQPQPRMTKVLLWVGRFEAEKNPLLAIDILAAARAQGIDASLILLGAGSLEHALRKHAHAKGLVGYVSFPGWQAPAPYIAQADVCISTSRFEGYGASIVEALAAGVPVVAPDVGVAKEAGAIVVPNEQLAQATIDTLRSGVRGTLRLPVLTKEEWSVAWRWSL